MRKNDKNSSPYFLPYQAAWLKDRSRYKIIEKSRRVGMTYVQSYEDVVDAARADGGVDVWFSSADESAAREYARYCEQWVKLYRMAGSYLGETVIDSEEDIKAFTIEFANGKRINALSSNPKAFRSKGGKLILDEFAFHAQPDALWKAAIPIITWGFPVRVLSTYNGKGNRYYRMVEEAKKGNGWSLHTVTIEDAVRQGLADRIAGRPLSDAERARWLAEAHVSAGDEETWQQEYMCIPVDEATAFLTYDLISAATDPRVEAIPEWVGPLVEAAEANYGEYRRTTAEPPLPMEPLQGLEFPGELYIGVDIGRKKDLTVIWVDAKVGETLKAVAVVVLAKTPFFVQRHVMQALMRLPGFRRACIDETGIGADLAESCVDLFGAHRVEPVSFSAAIKEALAEGLKQNLEDRRSVLPGDKRIRASLHSVRRYSTATKNFRFDAERSEETGHADHFWAKALAVQAASAPAQAMEFEGTGEMLEAQYLESF
ncbi:MAG: terminase family protein [Syntrophobacteraceae bacterium]